MPKSGRPPSIESNKIIDAVLQESGKIIISKSGNIAEKKDPIWTILSGNLQNLITPGSLYSYVTTDRFQLKVKLFEREGIGIPSADSTANTTVEEESVNETNASDCSLKENITRTYSINSSKLEYEALVVTKTRIRKSRKNQRNLQYKDLRPGIWEDVINDKLVEYAKITCGLNFKNHHLSADGSSGTFKAHCNCGSSISGIIKENELDKNFMEVICTISKGPGKCGKRWLRNQKRKETVEEIGEETVHIYRARKADEKMKQGDAEPPNLPSSPVLRLARHEARKKKFIDPDPVRALKILKYTDYAYIIRNIGLDPFYVHYWTRHQINIYRDYATRESSCLCIDATGSIIRKIKKYDGVKSKSIYLYHGVIRLNEGQFPVIRMISDSQNTNTIHFWLMEWIRSGDPSPQEVVIDGGRAIITAAIRAFTTYFTIDEYADACYGPNVPQCYIRMDNAHFMNTYVKLLKNVPPRVGIFYKAAIGQLIISRTPERAKKIIRSLLIICQLQTEGNLSDGSETEVDRAKNFLKALITNENVHELTDFNESKLIDNEVESTTENDSIQSDTSSSTNNNEPKKKRLKKSNKSNHWMKMGQEINEDIGIIAKTQIGNRTNAHFMPAFKTKLMNDLSDLPLWSCITRDKFGFGRVPASSACVESDFNITKNILLKNAVLPIRVDEYLQKYISYINGRLKIIEAKIIQDQKDETDTKTDNLLNKDENLDNESNDGLKTDKSTNGPSTVSCPACLNYDKPTGMHKCFICYTPVHNLDSCSSPLDIGEGCSQTRVCFPCSKSGNIKVILASREKENWNNETLQEPALKPKLSLAPTMTSTKSKKSKYYGEQSHLINEQLQMAGKCNKISILRNGSDEKLRAAKIDGKSVNAILTCPFDSVYQLVAAAICDWPELRAKIKSGEISNPIFNLALSIFEKKITAASYAERTRLHYDFIEHDKQTNGSILLRCETSVMQIILRMFVKTPSCTITVRCDKCSGQMRKDIIAPIIYPSDIKNNDLDMTKLGDLSMTTKCRVEGCSGRKKTSISDLGDIIIFEVFNAQGDVRMKLDDLPRK